MTPRIIFDTSGINAIEKSGAASEPLMRRLQDQFRVILTAMSAEEIIATACPELREALLARFERLWRLGADCICPPHHIIQLLISAHSTDPSQFDWTAVEVIRTAESREVGYTIARRDFDDGLCEQQRTQNREVGKVFERMFRGLRPSMDTIFADGPHIEEPCERPKNYREAVALAAQEGGFLWKFGQWLYNGVSGRELTEVETKSFMEICPPFRAVCYSLIMAAYNWPLRAHDANKRPSAGRNDLYMAAYLPYCDHFITNDDPQKANLRELVAETGMRCEILRLNEFDVGCARHLAVS